MMKKFDKYQESIVLIDLRKIEFSIFFEGGKK